MGTEALWIPLVVGGLSAGANYYNTRRTLKKQDNELAAQIIAQGRRQSEADAAVRNAILKTEQSNPDGQRRTALNSYLEQLQRSQGNATAGLGQIGAVSSRYADDADAAGADIAARGQQTADIMSRIDAPVRQRQDEGVNFMRLGTDIDRVRALSDSDRYIGDIRMRSIRRNPWLDALSQAASGFATSFSGGGG
jgi:hypothetical protein